MKCLLLFLFTLALAQSQNNGFVKSKNRIINGFKVDAMNNDMLNLIRSTVRLHINKGASTSACGGSLISPNFVLTAAHCMRSYKLNPDTNQNEESIVQYVDLFFGITNLNVQYLPETVRRKVYAENVFIHNKFNPLVNVQYDLALVKLTEPVYNVPGKISCISLPDNNICSKPMTKLTISGWGRIEGFVKTDDIRAVDVQIQPAKKCSGFKTFSQYMHHCLLGTAYEKSCSGDSGGPAAFTDLDQNNKQYLLGVDSFGACDINYTTTPSVYSNVCASDFRDWIALIAPNAVCS